MANLPNVKRPCKDCPFRKDCERGWLGETRMREIINGHAFVCHKTTDTTSLQCAGFMLLKGNESTFVHLAKDLQLDTGLTGRELVFNNKAECIAHHAN